MNHPPLPLPTPTPTSFSTPTLNPNQVLSAQRKKYCVLSSRALYLFKDKFDPFPMAYIKLEGLCCHAAPKNKVTYP